MRKPATAFGMLITLLTLLSTAAWPVETVPVRGFGPDARGDAARGGLPTPDMALEECLGLAARYRADLQAERALETYERTATLHPGVDSILPWIDTLLAYGMTGEASEILTGALDAHPEDPDLLLKKAVLLLLRGEEDESVASIRRAWDAGADRCAWLNDAFLLGVAGRDPYRGLIPESDPLADFPWLSRPSKLHRLALLEDALPRGLAPVLASFLIEEDDPHQWRRGIRALENLGSFSFPHLEALLETPRPRLRAMALEALADLHGRLGQAGPAERRRREVREGIEGLRDATEGDSSLAAYRECMENDDLRDIRILLDEHRRGPRLDGRLWGLPEDDFDDAQGLTIAERRFIREIYALRGTPLPTSGSMQYPREIRHWLESFGGLQCGRLLPGDSGLPEDLGEDPAEVKVYEDTSVDNEVNIVVNPYDPRHLVATSNGYGGGTGNDLYTSSDWGKTWAVGDVPASQGACDPVSYYGMYEGEGVVYHSYLTYSSLEMAYSTDDGATWNDCARIYSSGQDRQDHAIDNDPNSSCCHTIYVAWQYGPQFTRASTGDSFPYCQSWGAVHETTVSGTLGSAVVVSGNFGSAEGTPAPAHNFFTKYSAPAGVYESRTEDCGATWETALRWSIYAPGDYEWGIPSTCTRPVYYYPQADADRQPLSAYRNNIYVAWNELNDSCTPPGCSGNTTCNNDIMFGKAVPDDSDDPSEWTFLPKVNLTAPGGPLASDLYTDEFYPSLTVDPSDGSIYVSFYQTGSGSGGDIIPRKEEIHYVLARSIDGGESWESHRVTDLPTNESGSGAYLSMQWGDYTWNDVIDGVCYPAWTDRREGLDEDIWAAKVCSSPAHWSERAPDFQTPETRVVPGDPLHLEVSWDVPDLYWGDGGEDPSRRKYQLWVDGVLEEDDIPWTAAGTSYLASDCHTPHDIMIRAVNQCGVAKDYAAAEGVFAEGCCEANPRVTLAPEGSVTLCVGTSQPLVSTPTGGTPPFTYQWTRDGEEIPGATTDAYVADGLGTHAYNCWITGSGCDIGAAAPHPVILYWTSVPEFPGIESVTDPRNETCTLDLTWPQASGVCPGPVTYNVYRSTNPSFIPDPSNRIAQGWSGGSYSDSEGLINGTEYYYVVRAVEGSTGGEEGNTIVLSGIPTGPSSGYGILFSDGFETDTGWTFSGGGEWERGAPQGQGGTNYGKPDPPSAFSGSMVLGNDLSGTGNDPYDYERSVSQSWATSPPLDCTGGKGMTLSFQRWLNVEGSDYDLAIIQVSDGSRGWTEVWRNTVYEITDVSWSQQEVDIAAVADGKKDVRIRFGIQSDSGWQYSGWNIDEVTVSGELSAACSTSSSCVLQCSASAEPGSGQAPLDVRFSATVTASDCLETPVVTWDFGDGAAGAGETVDHSFAEPGQYDWSLLVTADQVSCTRSGTVTVSSALDPGDCDGSGTISIGEVQRAINMFLGMETPACGVDADSNGTVSVGEVQQVINLFLGA